MYVFVCVSIFPSIYKIFAQSIYTAMYVCMYEYMYVLYVCMYECVYTRFSRIAPTPYK